MVDVDGSSLSEDHRPSWWPWSAGWQHLALSLHSSNEAGELLKRLWPSWRYHTNCQGSMIVIIICGYYNTHRGVTETESRWPINGDWTRSHHTGVSPSSLAPCYCPHSVQNRTADTQDTHYPSAELYSRPTPAALLVTTTQVRQSQPAWNSTDENRFRSMQLHLQGSTHLEQSTSHHHWQLGRHCKHFQKGTQNVLLH